MSEVSTPEMFPEVSTPEMFLNLSSFDDMPNMVLSVEPWQTPVLIRTLVSKITRIPIWELDLVEETICDVTLSRPRYVHRDVEKVEKVEKVEVNVEKVEKKDIWVVDASSRKTRELVDFATTMFTKRSLLNRDLRSILVVLNISNRDCGFTRVVEELSANLVVFYVVHNVSKIPRRLQDTCAILNVRRGIYGPFHKSKSLDSQRSLIDKSLIGNLDKSLDKSGQRSTINDKKLEMGNYSEIIYNIRTISERKLSKTPTIIEYERLVASVARVDEPLVFLREFSNFDPHLAAQADVFSSRNISWNYIARYIIASSFVEIRRH